MDLIDIGSRRLLTVVVSCCMCWAPAVLLAASPKLQPPLKIAEPAPPAKVRGGVDLSQQSAATLAAQARDRIAAGDYAAAIQLQYWSVHNGSGDEGLYNLACYYSLHEQATPGFYWLQRAVFEEGVEEDWLLGDKDLNHLRSDDRWQAFETFFKSLKDRWADTGLTETTLVLPSDYDGQKPLPLLIGLHGWGSRAKEFVTAEAYQATADELGIALLGVSGTIPRGAKSYMWSGDVERDEAHLDAAIAGYAEKFTPAPGQTILLGFSQGARMSLEIAARKPDKYLGVLAMSTGGGASGLPGVKPAPDHKRQSYVIVCNAGERPGTVAGTAAYAKRIGELHARVRHQAFAGESGHTLPPGYWDRLHPWLAFLLHRDTPLPPSDRK